MKFRLKPRNDSFFALFAAAGENLITGSNLLFDLIRHCPSERQQVASRLREAEHRGDEITHES